MKKLYLFLLNFIILFQFVACNTINIVPSEFDNAEFFLDARFFINITENKNNNAQNNYQGNLIFTKNNSNFNLKILSPLNTLLAEIKNTHNATCLYKNADNSNNLIPEYCDENIDLLVNYFLQNNSDAFITISEIPNWLKRNFPKNAKIIYDNYKRIQRVDLTLSNENNQQNYILIYHYKTENDTIPYRLTIQFNNDIYLKLIINNWKEN